jgi:hypothetical protein
LSGLTSLLMLATLTFKPLHPTPAKSSRPKSGILSQLVLIFTNCFLKFWGAAVAQR